MKNRSVSRFRADARDHPDASREHVKGARPKQLGERQVRDRQAHVLAITRGQEVEES